MTDKHASTVMTTTPTTSMVTPGALETTYLLMMTTTTYRVKVTPTLTSAIPPEADGMTHPPVPHRGGKISM